MILGFAHTPDFLKKNVKNPDFAYYHKKPCLLNSTLFSISYFLHLLVWMRGYFDDLRLLIFI